MTKPLTGLLLIPFVLLLAISAQAQNRASLELEVHMINAGIGAQQTWGEMLAEVGADRVSLKSVRKRAKPDVEESEFRQSKHYLVIGVLSGGRLNLPGGKSFTARDKDRIAAYLKKIRDDGPKTALSEKMAFGMTAEQLVGLQQDLAQNHKTATKGQRVLEIVDAIRETIKTPLQIDSSARMALAGKDKIAEELKSLSCGTTLAAILRPLGLVAVPHRKQGKSVEIIIVESRKAKEHWPIGWPNEKGNALAAPKMFEKKDVNIQNAKLNLILDAMEKRCELPFLYDHNSMARHGADPTKLTATIVKKKQTYFAVVRQALSQVRPQMKPEIRLDDAGQPFLWITTFKK